MWESKSQGESMAFPLSILVCNLCGRNIPTPEAPKELEVETRILVQETTQLMIEDLDVQVSTPKELVKEVSSALRCQVVHRRSLLKQLQAPSNLK